MQQDNIIQTIIIQSIVLILDVSFNVDNLNKKAILILDVSNKFT